MGKLIAEAGFKLVNGGYSGTMEATAKGAAEVEGSVREGVIVPKLFRSRPDGNKYLTESTATPTILDRIQVMCSKAPYFIIMNGERIHVCMPATVEDITLP